MPVVLALRRQRQAYHCEFEAGLIYIVVAGRQDYTVRLCLNNNNHKLIDICKLFPNIMAPVYCPAMNT